MTTYRRAVDVLRALPEVFALSDAGLVLKSAPDETRTYIHRWKRAGLVDPLGPRCGIYFNLLRDPQGRSGRWLDAMRRLCPSAVIIGPEVLHAHGWITQIPSVLDVAVLTARTYPEVHGARLHGRAGSWYAALPPETAAQGLPPAWALADALCHSGLWRPDPDDLDYDLADMDEVENAFNRICPAGTGDRRRLDAYLAEKPGPALA